MKKITLIIAATLAFLSSTAQDRKSSYIKTKAHRHSVEQKMIKNTEIIKNNLAKATPIFTEDFGGGIPGTWQVIDNVAAGLLWTFGFGPTGGGAIPGDSLLSTTAANGFAIVDDDAFGGAAPPRNTDLITPAINCSANLGVRIEFQEYFLEFNTGIGTLSISVDGGVSYQDIYVVSLTTPNPQITDIDVTTVAAGVADVRFKFNYQGNYDYWWQVDDINVYQQLSTDGTLLQVESAPTSCLTSSTEMVTVAIKNSGINPISNFPVSFKVDGGTPVTENYLGSIIPGDTGFYLFNATADLSAPGNHTITSWIAVPLDGNNSNDTASYSMKNLSPIVINGTGSMTMGFEPGDDLTGWMMFDANGDDSLWALAFNPDFLVSAHAGDYCLRVAPAGNDVDDWLFSSCVTLQSGTNYTLDYWVHLFNFAGTVEAFVGTSNDVLSMTQSISNTPGAVGSWVNGNGSFTVPATGTYYIGFHGYEPAGAGVLRLDDIHLTLGVGVSETSNEAKWFDVYPNPATDNLNIRINRPYVNADIEVINSVGAVVKSFKAEESTRTIDLSNLESGLYTINIKFDGKAVNKRFTISK